MKAVAPVPSRDKAPPAPGQYRIYRGALYVLRNCVEYRGHQHWWARQVNTGDEGLYPDSKVRRWPLARTND